MTTGHPDMLFLPSLGPPFRLQIIQAGGVGVIITATLKICARSIGSIQNQAAKASTGYFEWWTSVSGYQTRQRERKMKDDHQSCSYYS